MGGLIRGPVKGFSDIAVLFGRGGLYLGDWFVANLGIEAETIGGILGQSGYYMQQYTSQRFGITREDYEKYLGNKQLAEWLSYGE